MRTHRSRGCRGCYGWHPPHNPCYPRLKCELRQAEFEHRGELLGWYRSGGITNYLESIVRIDFLRGLHQIRMRLFENPVRETLLTQIRNTVFRHGRGTAI